MTGDAEPIEAQREDDLGKILKNQIDLGLGQVGCSGPADLPEVTLLRIDR